MKKIIGKYHQYKKKWVVAQRRQHEYIVNRYYAHLIDPFFTHLAYKLRLTPNQVTTIALAFGVLSALAIFSGNLIWGGVLLQLHHYIDGADGNLARLTRTESEFGALYDKVSDQVVRVAVFSSVAWVTDVGIYIKSLFLLTIYFDILLVHFYILPCLKKYKIIRAKWKRWFLDRGIIPGFDHFTIFFVISFSTFFDALSEAVVTILVLKTIDWLYRLYECRFRRGSQEN